MKNILLPIKELGELQDFTDLLYKRVEEGLTQGNVLTNNKWVWTDTNETSANYHKLHFHSNDIGEVVLNVIVYFKNWFYSNEKSIWHDKCKRFYIINSIIVRLSNKFYYRNAQQ